MTNTDLASELLQGGFSEKELRKINELFHKMDKLLYKSYLKEMPFNELRAVVACLVNKDE